jgi:hypothetical protein
MSAAIAPISKKLIEKQATVMVPVDCNGARKRRSLAEVADVRAAAECR